MFGFCCFGGAERERGWEIELEFLFFWERLGSIRYDGVVVGGWVCFVVLFVIR